jgi:hypothetical protein
MLAQGGKIVSEVFAGIILAEFASWSFSEVVGAVHATPSQIGRPPIKMPKNLFVIAQK